ncbi:DUF6335 family protein [Candidatus Cyanaurora vandensis]|uniref:DUF6335 family protein n=1 Tax=Candidatus Cyanaurora vandensis TaxID=2714958 RepID=UPI0025804B91|nr:DUF6335 family protein [Candidatus Cyanaurora vandensis]
MADPNQGPPQERLSDSELSREAEARGGVDEAFVAQISESSRAMLRHREQYNETDATLSGGDVDAAWEDEAIGEEAVGGTVMTPDQDIVDELGRAVGLTVAETEELGTEDILIGRDDHPYLLDPASAEDFQERQD